MVATDRDLAEPVTIQFSVPMDEASVGAALTVTPSTPVTLSWDPDGHVLTVVPQGHWAAGTYHTVTVDAGALAASGAPMATPARAAFLTRDAAAATIAATLPAGKRIGIGERVHDRLRPRHRPRDRRGRLLDRPGDAGHAGADGLDARRPGRPRRGTTSPSSGRSPRPSPLLPNTTLPRDARRRPRRGRRRGPGRPRSRCRPASPRPSSGSGREPTRRTSTRSATISVRFTQPMDEASTKAAFKVLAGKAAVAGKVTFAEDDTVLVFEPAKALPYGTKVTMSVATTARSRDGAPLGRAAKGAFRTVPKPAGRRAGARSTGGSTGGRWRRRGRRRLVGRRSRRTTSA